MNYDCNDRMTSVIESDTSLQSVSYGPDGKRLSLTDSSGARKFFYDGDDVIQEYDSDWSTVTREYTHGPWTDEPLSMTEHGPSSPSTPKRRERGASAQSSGAEALRLMKDRLGSIINILDENEALKTTYSYDAFGEPTATYHSGQVDCAYRFTGREYDAGMGNYFYRARYYNQSLGRFFSRDPIMSLGSLYAYCSNSPENFTDPTGMVASSSLCGGSIGITFGMYAPGCWPRGGGGGKPRILGPESWCVSSDPNADDDADGISNKDDPDWEGDGDDSSLLGAIWGAITSAAGAVWGAISGAGRWLGAQIETGLDAIHDAYNILKQSEWWPLIEGLTTLGWFLTLWTLCGGPSLGPWPWVLAAIVYALEAYVLADYYVRRNLSIALDYYYSPGGGPWDSWIRDLLAGPGRRRG